MNLRENFYDLKYLTGKCSPKGCGNVFVLGEFEETMSSLLDN